MLNSRNFFAVLLMIAGIGLLAGALWLGLKPEAEPQPRIEQRQRSEAEQASIYLPTSHDWWLYVASSDAERFYQQPLLADLLGEAVQRELRQLKPKLLAFGPELIVWQLSHPVDAALLPELFPGFRLHRESIADGELLIWYQHLDTDIVIDRLAAPTGTKGELRSDWLNDRLGWQTLPCEPLASLLALIHPIASIHWQTAGDGEEWRLTWPVLDDTLKARLAMLQAPKAQFQPDDQWFAREANLRSLVAQQQCPLAPADLTGIVQRQWRQGEQMHQAALLVGTREGRQALATELALPLQRNDGESRLALASSEMGLQWALAQPKTMEQGLLQELVRQSPGQTVYSELRFAEQLELQLRFFHSPINNPLTENTR